MVPSGLIIGCEFCVKISAAETYTVLLHVRPRSSDQRSTCGAPRSWPWSLLMNRVQNWYSRPRCLLCRPVSTTNQFLSSNSEHCVGPLLWTIIGGPNVRPPSGERDTATAPAQSRKLTRRV